MNAPNSTRNIIKIILLVSFFLFFLLQKPHNTYAASVSWDGGASTTNWSDALNWSTDSVPGADDDVLIDTTVTVNIAATTTINSLTLGNSGGTSTAILNFSYNAVGTSAPLIIDSGDLTIYSAAQITHSAGTTAVVGSIYIEIQTGDLDIIGTGKINADSKGYRYSAGTGKGTDGGIGTGGGAGGYGGAGSSGHTGVAGGAQYGDLTNPAALGSGGGTAYGSGTAYGGSGGGLIILDIAGELSLAGSITANGATGGTAASTSLAGGGGSGGGIKITCNTFSGTGSITANGGNGGNNTGSDGGGGGGGRIAIEYSSKTHSGSITAYGGNETYNNKRGAAGSIYLNGGIDNTTLIIDNNPSTSTYNDAYTKINTEVSAIDYLIVRNKGKLNLDHTVTFNTIDLESSGYLFLSNGSISNYTTFNFTSGTVVDRGGTFDYFSGGGAITIASGNTYYADYARSFSSFTLAGTLRHTANSSSKTYYIDIDTSGDFEITNTGAITASSAGYGSNSGSGAGTTGGIGTGAGGGAYGGNGGNGDEGKAGGTAYGDNTNPIDLGSGGGAAYGNTTANGANGGGLIMLDIDGEFIHGGAIYANGGTGSISETSLAGGGGAGGSINITCAKISGSGSVTANGGWGGTNCPGVGGGGGGGRIAINYGSSTYTGTVTYNGGTGPDAATDGAVGSYYFNQTNQTPTASATNISSQNSLYDLYPDQSYSFQTVYSDADGASNLDGLYLQIKNPAGTDIEYYATNSETELLAQSPTLVSGSDYISSITYDITPQSPTANDVTVMWHIELDWDWTRGTEIQYGVKASDINSATSTYDYTVSTYLYENRLTFTGTLSATDESDGSVSSGDWVLPNSVVSFTGIKVVFNQTVDIYPNDDSFNVQVINDEAEIWYDNTSSGQNIDIDVTTVDGTNMNDEYIFSITDIPTGGSDISSSSFVLKTDKTAPLINSLTSTTHPNDTLFYGTKDVTFSWNSSDGQSGMDKVYRLIDQNETQLASTVIAAGVQDLAIGTFSTTIPTDGTWYIHLVALDNSNMTKYDSFKINIDTTGPSITSLTSTTHPSQSSWYSSKFATMSWTTADQGSGIKETYKLVNQNSASTISDVLTTGTVSAANTIWTTPELSNGTSYVHLVAVDNLDETSYAKYTLKIDSSLPDIVSINGNYNNTLQNYDSGPLISWTDPKSISDDIFYITNDGTTPTSSNYKYSTLTSSLDLPSQKEGTTTIKVRAQNGAGTYSDTKTFTIRYDSIAPSNVSSLSTYATKTSVTLTWINPTASDFSKIAIERDGTKIYEGSATTFLDENLLENTTYSYKVYSYDSLGNKSSGATVQAITSANTQAPVAPPITSETKIINIEEMTEQPVEIKADDKSTQPNSSGNVHVYTNQSISIEIPAEVINSETDDTKQVLLVMDDRTYIMEYDGENDTYKTTISAPSVRGTYDTKIQTVSHDNVSKLAILMSIKVDPYGYVYSKSWNNEIRISGAKVTLYKMVDGVQTLWISDDGTENPQITENTGEYNFFVEPGEYKISVEATGYKPKETDWFKVETNIIEINIEMERTFTIWYVIIGLIVIITIISISVVLSRRKREDTI